jgi:hypothetical protein
MKVESHLLTIPQATKIGENRPRWPVPAAFRMASLPAQNTGRKLRTTRKMMDWMESDKPRVTRMRFSSNRRSTEGMGARFYISSPRP